jgi:hypothetical protein
MPAYPTHTFFSHLAVMALLLAEHASEEVDVCRVLQMLLVHDLVEIDAGDTPDILDFSPDGRYAYITQRGPNPLSGDPHVAVGSEAGRIGATSGMSRSVHFSVMSFSFYGPMVSCTPDRKRPSVCCQQTGGL